MRGDRKISPCGWCETLVDRLVSQIKSTGRMFCGRACANLWRARFGKRGGFKPGHTPWNTGFTKDTHPGVAAIAEAKRADNPMRRDDVRRKSSASHAGKRLSVEQRARMSETHKQRVLDGKSNVYIDGRYAETKKRRMSFDYKLWRDQVFMRDAWTCCRCGANDYLEAHHTKPWSEFPELRFDVANGVTLCLPCHVDVDPGRARTMPKVFKPSQRFNLLQAA